ncbi:MAG: helix-turn-helix transcriptional regulator [Euzebyaceae bacterium]|nr:helix-turn-helix transcriptional regulator [Euzebyaceae bacterium]
MAEQPADAVFFALADATRRAVLRRLSDEGALTATTLAAGLPISRQAVGKHLAALTAAGLVSVVREGRERRYRLTPEPLHDAVEWVAQIGARWDVRLARLQRRLAQEHTPTSR